jgi:hypothetical protein
MIENYINRHTVMGMMSKNYEPFPDHSGFYRNRDRTKVTVFDAGFRGDFKEIRYCYLPERTIGSASSTLLVSRLDPVFFAMRGRAMVEFRETRNKWDRLAQVREVPGSIQDVLSLIDAWDELSGRKYGFIRHSGYDRNFFRRYWEAERDNLYSLFFYCGDQLVGYSITSKLQDDNCFRYVIRKCDISAGRNIGLYVDIKTFETIFADAPGGFLVNWGASSGKVLEYKRKFPIFLDRKVYSHKVAR